VAVGRSRGEIDVDAIDLAAVPKSMTWKESCTSDVLERLLSRAPLEMVAPLQESAKVATARIAATARNGARIRERVATIKHPLAEAEAPAVAPIAMYKVIITPRDGV
jgi:hypothetical protein